MVELKFTGALVLDDTTGNWSIENSDGATYVGTPSTSIDRAWESLLEGERNSPIHWFPELISVQALI